MNKNKALSDEFRVFCAAHPELRFWQALRAWSGLGFILKADGRTLEMDIWDGLQDTFYWEGKNE